MDGLAGVRGTVATMDEAISEMEALDRLLPPDDGLAAFNFMYLQVTRLVAEQVGRDFFLAPDVLARLDVVFANRYLGALAAAAAGRPVPACWKVLLDHRRDPSPLPLQFALVGMNAHINHDLVLALVDVFTEKRRSPHDRAFHSDFTRVNELLARIEDGVRRSLTRLSARLEHDLGHAEDCIGRWSIATARAVAWHDAAVLWEVRGHRRLVERMTHALDTAVAGAAACLLLPLTHRRGARHECGCIDQTPHLQRHRATVSAGG